jgi:hypothetical protein
MIGVKALIDHYNQLKSHIIKNGFFLIRVIIYYYFKSDLFHNIHIYFNNLESKLSLHRKKGSN